MSKRVRPTLPFFTAKCNGVHPWLLWAVTRAMLDEQACEIQPSILRHYMQRCPSVIVLGCHVPALLDEQTCEIYASILRRQMQWRPPVHVLAIRPELV